MDVEIVPFSDRRRVRKTVLALLPMLVLLTVSTAGAAPVDPSSSIDGIRGEVGARRIIYAGTIVDRADLAEVGVGAAGYWFAQFNAAVPVAGQPTGENVRDELPSWVAAFNHTEHPADPGCTEADALRRGCMPTYNFRTFSQDGPARSAGGFASWATLRLPSGESGTAGAIVDPHTFTADQPNNNNTINRIQLHDGVPATFFVGVVADTTGTQHDPGRLEVRGNVGLLDHREEVANSQVEPTTVPTEADLATNGVPDIHVFRVEHFESGDYLKLRLRGRTSPASFTGILFDTSFEPVLGRS